MADLLFKCSGCSRPLAVEDDCIGQAIECPGCKQQVLVPQPGCVFRCSKCHGQLLAPAGMSGQSINCPTCDTGMTVPPPSKKRIVIQTAPPQPASQVAPQPPSERKCPYCCGSIAPAAIICVNCGINLRTGQQYGARQSMAIPPPSDSTAVILTVTILGILLVVGGICFWLSIQHSKYEQAETGRRHQVEEQQREQEKIEQQKVEQQHAEQAKVEEQRRNMQAEAARRRQIEEQRNEQARIEQQRIAQQQVEQEKAEQAKTVWADIVLRGVKKSPPDKDAAGTFLSSVAAQIADAMVKNGTVVSATPTGQFDMQQFGPKDTADANAMIFYQWVFWTKAGLQRRTSGGLFFYHSRDGNWYHQPAGDIIDGMPYYK